MQTMLNCIDNSGAAIVECVAVMKKRGMRPTASIGTSLSEELCHDIRLMMI